MWDELVNLLTTIEMLDEEDALIWQFQSNGCIPPNLYIV
jgi:hypothetical protein